MFVRYNSLGRWLIGVGLLISRIEAFPIIPTTITVTPSFVTNVAVNTHFSTVGVNGQATAIPIVSGPQCWFCPKLNSSTVGGWALIGINSPGTYHPIAPQFSDIIPIIVVSLNGDPSYYQSPKKRDKVTIVEREIAKAVPTTISYHKDSKYEKLMDSYVSYKHLNLFKKLSEWEWPDSGRYAIKIKIGKKGFANLFGLPEHYMLAAGPINSTTEDEEVKNDEGEVIEVRRKIRLYFNALSYDIGRAGKRVLYINRGKMAAQWDTKYINTNFQWRGKVKDSFTEEYIEAVGKEIAQEMDEKGFNILSNNCLKFANKLWETIKA